MILIPHNIREQQINDLPNIEFIRWDDIYKNSHSRAVVKCTVDGFEWNPRISDILLGGKGCPHCAGNRRWTPSERITQIDNMKGITFIQWEGIYHGAFSKAKCRCDNGHEWSSSVHSLLNNKSGCPTCAKYGYDRTARGTLYALRSECGTMVKIGISNDVHRRHSELMRNTPFRFECVELCHGDGSLIATLEKVLHDLMKPVEFDRPFDGSTEWREWDDRLPIWFEMYRGWS